MYSKYENPILKASVFYYDNIYDEIVSTRVLKILKDYSMFPPHKLCADKLTHHRYLKASDTTESIFIKAYKEKDVFGVDMASGDGGVGSEFWRFTWGLTFYKRSNIDTSNVVFNPWNIISLSSTYGRLHDNDVYDGFINCVKNIISEIKPFYASIDDVNNKITKAGTHGLRFDDKTLPSEIHWGNFWGKQYVEKANPLAFDFLLQNGAICEEIGEGKYFSMTDSAFDFNSKKVIQLEHKFGCLSHLKSYKD